MYTSGATPSPLHHLYTTLWTYTFAPYMLCPVTLTWLHWQTSASSETGHIPCHTPGTSSTSELISPWSTLSQLHTDSRDSRNLVSALELGIHRYRLNIAVLSLVPSSSSILILVPVPVPVFRHSIPVFPSCTHRFPVSDPYSTMFLSYGYALWLVYITPTLYIFDMFEYRLWLLFSLSTRPLVTSNIIRLCNPPTGNTSDSIPEIIVL